MEKGRRRGVAARMGGWRWSLIVLLTLALSRAYARSECETYCATKNCTDDDVCVCQLPDPDSVMMGDRSFLGGVFCDTPATMCDDTDNYWCESGGLCNEVVQGENYTCTCVPGFAGEHCQTRGDVCGEDFCYNGGTCNEGRLTSTCVCPPQFRGSPDCSLPTPEAPSPEGSLPVESKSRGEWYKPVVIILAIVLVLLCLGSLLFKWQKKRAENLSRSRFHELRQVQMIDGPDFYDDGEDDPFADTPKAQHKPV